MQTALLSSAETYVKVSGIENDAKRLTSCFRWWTFRLKDTEIKRYNFVETIENNVIIFLLRSQKDITYLFIVI